MYLVQCLDAKPMMHEVRDTFGPGLTYARTLVRRGKAARITPLKLSRNDCNSNFDSNPDYDHDQSSVFVMHCPGFI